MKSLVFATLLLAACTDETATRATLAAHGVRNVSINGADWRLCGNVGITGTLFTGTNTDGESVSGAACCGVTGLCRIHYEPDQCRGCKITRHHIHELPHGLFD